MTDYIDYNIDYIESVDDEEYEPRSENEEKARDPAGFAGDGDDEACGEEDDDDYTFI